jgi:ureidoglycolate hydrolase
LANVHKLKVELMTAESFSLYGEVMEAKERPSAERRFFPITFDIDGRTTVDVIWQPFAERTFSTLERHFNVTQSFIPLEGSLAVVAVAPATDLDNWDAIPKPDDVRAFLIDPAKGFAYKTGTWHSLNRYILTPPGASFIILNVDPNPSQVVDYQKEFGVTFEVDI